MSTIDPAKAAAEDRRTAAHVRSYLTAAKAAHGRLALALSRQDLPGIRAAYAEGAALALPGNEPAPIPAPNAKPTPKAPAKEGL